MNFPALFAIAFALASSVLVGLLVGDVVDSGHTAQGWAVATGYALFSVLAGILAAVEAIRKAIST